jgi:hypothetical protein
MKKSKDEDANKFPDMGAIVVQALLLDLVTAQNDNGNDAPALLIHQQRIRVSRVFRIAQSYLKSGCEDGQVLLDLILAVQAQDKGGYKIAMSSLSAWHTGFLRLNHRQRQIRNSAAAAA